MKVYISKDTLSKGLSIVSRAVAARSAMPVLANILLATDQGRLKLSATNLEIGINCWVDAQVEGEGAITVPARLLREYVGNLPNERVAMEVAETCTLNLSCARIKTNLRGIEAAEFPAIPVVSDAPSLTISPDLLKEMVSQVAFAATTRDAAVLSGILASFDGPAGTLTLAAADGFRLSVRSASLPSGNDQQGDMIVPAYAMQEVARIVSATHTNDDGQVTITVAPNKSHVLFHASNVDVVSHLLEGKFPSYQQLIPSLIRREHKTRAVVNTADFLKAVRRASIFAQGDANAVALDLQPGEDGHVGHLTLRGTSIDVGDNEEDLEAAVEGEAMQIAFRARYLADILGVLKAEQVILETTIATAPGVLKPVGMEGFIHLVMPMQVTR